MKESVIFLRLSQIELSHCSPPLPQKPGSLSRTLSSALRARFNLFPGRKHRCPPPLAFPCHVSERVVVRSGRRLEPLLSPGRAACLHCAPVYSVFVRMHPLLASPVTAHKQAVPAFACLCDPPHLACPSHSRQALGTFLEMKMLGCFVVQVSYLGVFVSPPPFMVPAVFCGFCFFFAGV